MMCFHKDEYFAGYKQSQRKEDDIAIVNAGMQVLFKEHSDLIHNIHLAFGGMAPTAVMATKTMSKMIGKLV